MISEQDFIEQCKVDTSKWQVERDFGYGVFKLTYTYQKYPLYHLKFTQESIENGGDWVKSNIQAKQVEIETFVASIQERLIELDANHKERVKQLMRDCVLPEPDKDGLWQCNPDYNERLDRIYTQWQNNRKQILGEINRD